MPIHLLYESWQDHLRRLYHCHMPASERTRYSFRDANPMNRSSGVFNRENVIGVNMCFLFQWLGTLFYYINSGIIQFYLVFGGFFNCIYQPAGASFSINCYSENFPSIAMAMVFLVYSSIPFNPQFSIFLLSLI